MKIGSNDVLKIYLGSEEINKIYLGNELVYEAADPTPSRDIYMNGNAMVIKAGTEMPLYTSDSSGTYTLGEDVTITNLLSQQSGTLTNLDTYMYHPEFEEYDYSTVLTTTKVSSGSITIDGTTYNDSPSYTDMKNFWESAIIPNLYNNTEITNYQAETSASEQAYYYTIKCSGLNPNQKVSIADNYMFSFGSNLSFSTIRFKNVRIIFHSDADVTNSSAWLKDCGIINITRVLSPWSNNMGSIISNNNGEFYVTFLIPTSQPAGYIMKDFRGSIRGVKELYDTPLGVRLDAMNWQGEGNPNEIQIRLQSLDYGSERFKYLITVQTDGSAVITNNPNYQLT